MAARAKTSGKFNIVVIAQQGRLTFETVLFLASLRRFSPGFKGRVFVGEPQPGPNWTDDPTIKNDAARKLMTEEFGATILPFASGHFGQSYPYGNKIDVLQAMPPDEPFVFFDSDTLVTGEISQVPFDFDRPCASTRVTGTWPEPQLYDVGYTAIWASLYRRFGLDFESSLDLSEPEEYWRRYLYFNAGWFYYRCPRAFGDRFAEYACAIRDDPGPELASQSLVPWLDQIALPLVIHSFGGARDALPSGYLDGATSCHYRTMPLLFARESDSVIAALQDCAAPNKVKKVLKSYEPMKRFIYQSRGNKVRALFDQSRLPRQEAVIRNRIRKAGLWMR